MSAAEALRRAREHGIRVEVSGADLVLDADQEPAPTVLEALRCHKPSIVALLTAKCELWTADEWRAHLDERAGIAEFDSGQSREQAEALAFECCVVEWLNRQPCRSDPGRCAACNKPDRVGHTVDPFATESHAWVHPECWQDWYRAKKTEAVAALAAAGIPKPSKFPIDFGKNGSD